MNNYYFISSPLHFYIASNLAIGNDNGNNVAVIISKNQALAGVLQRAIQNVPKIFDETLLYVSEQKHSKWKQRRRIMKAIQQRFSSKEDRAIYTGNDRRVEFQYAMHISKTSLSDFQGIYMDDGAISYLGHKSMNSFAHRYLDPLFKKIVYGAWWKQSLTTGTSAWISDAYLAFPEFAHPLLKQKLIKPIDTDVFRSERFLELSKALLMDSNINFEKLKNAKLLISLPFEGEYKAAPEHLKSFYQFVLKEYDAKEILIKAHPRSNDDGLLDTLFPGASRIDKGVGFEFILPLLGDNIKIVGDVSTTLLSAKWLRPDIEVELIYGGQASPTLLPLLEMLGVRFTMPSHK